MFPYIITRETVTVTVDDVPHTIRKDAPNYKTLVQALLDDDHNAIVQGLTLCGVVGLWFRKYPEVTLNGSQILYQGVAIPESISTRIHAMISAGEDADPLIKAWERLSRNPSWRSTQQLYTFLQNCGIPLTKDGKFLAYKSVRSDWMDWHSNTIRNQIGDTVEMPRNLISDDPNEACHVGLHVGALEYAKGFGQDDRRVVVVEVDPEDVVCVPYDHSHQKMRVCRYQVVGQAAVDLPDTVWEPEFDDEDLEDKGVEDFGDNTSDVASSDSVDLASMSLDQLRRYAANTLKIIGASKIPGGKHALLQRIRDLK